VIHEAFLNWQKANQWVFKKLIVEEDETIKEFFEQIGKPENESLRSYLVLGLLSRNSPCEIANCLNQDASSLGGL